MAALVAAALAQASDRTPWLTAIMADRYQRPFSVIIGVGMALLIVNAVGMVAGMLLAPLLTPEARALFLAFALVSAGGSALFPIKPPDRMTGWRAGAVLTPLIAVLALGVGDRTQFITAAFAARTPVPGFALAGAVIGALAVNIPAILAGEAARKALPLTAIRIAIGVVLILWGAVSGLNALRLI